MNRRAFPPVQLLSPLEPFAAPQQAPNALGLGDRMRADAERVEFVPYTGETGQPGEPTLNAGSSVQSDLSALPVVRVSNAQKFAYLSSYTVQAPASISRVLLDQPILMRNMLAFRNLSATISIYLDFGKAASVNSIIELLPGGFILLDTVVPQDDVYVFASGGAADIAVAYSVFDPRN